MSRNVLSQRTVMPYSETPPNPEVTRSSSAVPNASSIRSMGPAIRFSAIGSILSPSMPTTPNPSFRRWWASV